MEKTTWPHRSRRRERDPFGFGARSVPLSSICSKYTVTWYENGEFSDVFRQVSRDGGGREAVEAMRSAQQQQRRKQNARLYLIRKEEKSLEARKGRLMAQRATLRVAEYEANHTLAEAVEKQERADIEVVGVNGSRIEGYMSIYGNYS